MTLPGSAPKTASTVIRLEKKPVEAPKPAPVQNAVSKALAQATVPKTKGSPKPSMRKALGQVFSQIGRHSLKNIAVGSGPKTLALTETTNSNLVPTTAKTFKALGSLGSGTGLQPSQFTKGATKEGGAGLGKGSIGGSQFGQISQGNIGQGDLGLIHKESQVTGGLDREVIAKYIASQKGKILYCYERQLSANPGLFGKVAVKFQIAASGAVENSQITESTINNNNVESCLLQLMATWQFPKPVGGVRVQVGYPFVFKSLN
jgi:TonB family protein